MRKIVLKIGGSVITDKTVPFKLRRNVLKRISKEIANALREDDLRLIIVHGGGSFGHYVASRYTGAPFVREAYLEIHEAMDRLNRYFISHLVRSGIKAITFQTPAIFVTKHNELYRTFFEPIIEAINVGLIPVLYGDIVFDVSNKFSILSGDTIAPYIAQTLNFNLLLYATNVNGVYRRFPPRGKKDLIHELYVKDLTEKSLRKAIMKGIIDVTGGMMNKLLEIKKWVRKRDLKIILFNALRKNYLYSLLKGEEIPVKTIIKVA